MPRHTTPHHTVPHYSTPHHTTPRHAMPCYATPYAGPRHAMPSHSTPHTTQPLPYLPLYPLSRINSAVKPQPKQPTHTLQAPSHDSPSPSLSSFRAAQPQLSLAVWLSVLAGIHSVEIYVPRHSVSAADIKVGTLVCDLSSSRVVTLCENLLRSFRVSWAHPSCETTSVRSPSPTKRWTLLV